MEISQIVYHLVNCGITDKLEQAHFLAQCDHESNGFTSFSEGTNYRFAIAKKVFPKYLKTIQIKQQAINAKDSDFCPQPWLFNLVYGSRMGNQVNGTNDNDGFDFRGGGFLQLTGKDNYTLFLAYITQLGYKFNLSDMASFVRTPEGAILSAIWFWQNNKIGEYARHNNTVNVSKLINCGNLLVDNSAIIGLDKRIMLTKKYIALLG